MARKNSGKTILVLGSLGILAGGVVGFLLRPVNALGWRLPFKAVITRGASLEALDRLMIPLAERSFNYVLVGAIIGLAAGALVGYLVTKR